MASVSSTQEYDSEYNSNIIDHLFYSLKYRNKLRRMLWENIREKNVIVTYSQVDDDEFQEVLDTW